MPAFLAALPVLAAIATRGVVAQQLTGRFTDYSLYGLSTACVAALNTTASCPSGLATLAAPLVPCPSPSPQAAVG